MAKTEINQDTIAAEKFAQSVVNKIAEGTYDCMINMKLSVNAIPFIKKKNRNIVIVHDGDLQYFIDKTNSGMVDQVRNILLYKERTAKEALQQAQTALEQMKSI